MVKYWNKLAIENGFNGIYLVEMLTGFQDIPFVDSSSAVVEFEPNYTLRLYTKHKIRYLPYRIRNKIIKIINKAHIISMDYDIVWQMMLRRKTKKFSNKEHFLGAFVNWDNTPRKGTRGSVFINFSPEKFDKYFKLQFEKAKTMKSKFLFINAWNEWAEGTYLEPDKKFKYSYLEVIKDTVNF